MTSATTHGIVAVQIGLLAITFLLTFLARTRAVGLALAWVNTVLAVVLVLMAGAAVGGVIAGISSVSRTAMVVDAVIGILAAAFTWVGYRVILNFVAMRQRKHLESPATSSRLTEELREVLRSEGIELDARLRQAEFDREQYLHALEDRHARQIAGLAQEYQHEAHTILRQLLDQLAAEQLLPMVEQRLAEQRKAIESELGAIDSAASGETLTTLRAEFGDLTAKVEEAEARIATLRADNPDSSIEDLARQRLDMVEAMIDERMTATKSELDIALATTVEALDARIGEVGALLDERVEAASNPLAARMADAEAQVEARLDEWTRVLDARFSETGQILNQRIVEQESALEQRVVAIEAQLAGRLDEHSTAIDAMLASHDEQLSASLAQQFDAVGQHVSGERDRLIGELTEHAVAMQEQVAAELRSAEDAARETVNATQVAWNEFTVELEERFAVTREEALRAAQEIAASERATLERELADITQASSGEIAAKVEELAREAAWQRAQVERTVAEQMHLLQTQAQDAVANADTIFGDLDRIGAERVEAIRRQAEDALVQSRDYVGQLQESLGAHLEDLRGRSTDLADEMNDRMSSITAASQDTATRLESYGHELIEATMTQLQAVADSKVSELQIRIDHEMGTSVHALLTEQQRAYEQHLAEISQRIVQQVQGDLSGIAEHARNAVAGELDQVVAQGRDHALRSQEQAHLQVMNELARQQSELSAQARQASDGARTALEQGMRDSRRMLEEAMASMGAHMREEMSRFQAEGQRRIDTLLGELRGREQELIHEEDRKLSAARQELVRQHEGAMQDQMRQMMTGLSGALGSPASGGSFTNDVQRPTTPLSGGQGNAFAPNTMGS